MEDLSTNTNYYAVLGIAKDATPAEIKAAFKKLALKYHPDVYKGEDAHVRMRLLLRAYQTLNDPVARRDYDAHIVAQRTSSVRSAGAYERPKQRSASATSSRHEISPSARRDRQRYYDFPTFHAGHPVLVDLIDIEYHLSPDEAQRLFQQGLLRGVKSEGEKHTYFCHRCHHRWKAEGTVQDVPRSCPKCQASDWTEYLLLRCIHCCAVFESEQIRYEIGTYAYGKKRLFDLTDLCPPYELFPLCPYCGTAHWCPAEEVRVQQLRASVAQRAMISRLIWIGLALGIVVLLSALVFGMFR